MVVIVFVIRTPDQAVLSIGLSAMKERAVKDSENREIHREKDGNTTAHVEMFTACISRVNSKSAL